MTATANSDKKRQRRSNDSVRSAAAGVAVKAAVKQGKTPDPALVKLAASHR